MPNDSAKRKRKSTGKRPEPPEIPGGLDAHLRPETVTELCREWAKIWKPDLRLSVSRHADEYRYLSAESSAKSGKYRSENAPYQREPMDSFNDPAVSMTVLMWASQLGKTEVVNNGIGYFSHAEPAPQLMVQPTIDLAEAWSKERLVPMIRDTPILREAYGDPKSRYSGNTILLKNYPGGNLAIAGANAPSGLASRPRRIVWLDEVDRYPVSAGTEGDPCAIAIRRTESYSNAFVGMTSTPTVKGLSRVEAEYNESDQRQWNCRCKECGKADWVIMWRDVKWEAKDGSDAWLECPDCGARHTDTERRAIVKAGRWVATADGKTKRGYWLNGINSLFAHKRAYRSRLHQMVAEFLDAKRKGPEVLKTWTNTFLAETYEEAGEKINPDDLANRREDYGVAPLPAGVLAITAGIDVQGDRVEIEIVGHGDGEESWGLEYEIATGNTERMDIWNAVEDVITRQYDHPSGNKMRISAVGIDTGHKAKRVYEFVKPRQVRKVFAFKGSSQQGAPIVSRPKKTGVDRVNLFMVGGDTGKESIFSRLQLGAGPGHMHFPKHYDEEYFVQLTAEKKVIRYRSGVPYATFHCPKGARNEALDCRVYANAALALLRPNWKRLAAIYRGKPIVAPDEDERKPEIRRPVKKARRGGFVGNW